MLIVVDYDNCLTDYPELFQDFENQDKHLIIITGRPVTQEDEIIDRLDVLGIDYTELILCPFEWHDYYSLGKCRRWKVKQVAELEPDLFIDDHIKTINEVQRLSPNTKCLLFINE